jgi:hypothetical protein
VVMAKTAPKKRARDMERSFMIRWMVGW